MIFRIYQLANGNVKLFKKCEANKVFIKMGEYRTAEDAREAAEALAYDSMTGIYAEFELGKKC